VSGEGIQTGFERKAPARGPSGGVARVVLLYAVVACCWIFFSDRLLGTVVSSPGAILWWSMMKGWLFVLVTSALLAVALRRLVRQVEEGRETLARSEAQFRTVVEAAFDAIVVETRARFAYANPAAVRLLGAKSEAELLGGLVVDRFPEDLRETVLKHMRLLNEHGQRVSPIELTVLRLDGTRVQVELSAVPCELEGEKGAMVLARDISSRRAGAAQLAEQFALTQAIVRSTRDAVSVKDREGRYLLVNPPMEEVLGRSSAELLGKTDESVFPGEVAAKILADDRDVMEAGEGRLVEETLPSGGGERRLLTSKSPLRNVEGQVFGVVGVARDIGDRVRMEEALRESEAKFATFMAHLPGFACIKDQQFRFVFMNTALESSCGLRPEEGLGRTAESLLPVDLATAARVGAEAVFRTGEPVIREECVERGGENRTFLTSHFPIRRADGGVFAGAIAVDITDRKRAEMAFHDLTARLISLQDEERRRLSKELHDTTAQDLTAIGLGLSRILQLLPAECPEQLTELVADCMRLVEQSGRDVRTLSYLLHPPLLDEMGLPAALREFVAGLSRRSGMKIEFICREDFGRLDRDREMALFRIAQESLANARRHAAESAVRVELFREGPDVVLEVSDRGGAMEPERLQALRRGSGTMGVGVLGMRERVRQLGGDLQVDSRAERMAVLARVPAAAPKGGGIT
jgi:PAS domain S-box-containing protein